MHRTKDALKLLACLLSRVHGARQQHLFFGLARLYAKHGLNKDALVSKLLAIPESPPIDLYNTCSVEGFTVRPIALKIRS